jgi:hypothetical protein
MTRAVHHHPLQERAADFDETASRLKVDTTPEDMSELEQEINKV